ncbi:hypothetical protein MRB53_007095 [Persea americana]|uniref:Uncharacterized protein n=1 Tax=Persea americana TaxID=3435 RepID=A0ACC2MJM3_PERAE|nr:hypothetical protein MRB53_007095 [Persea americana]
MVSAETTEDGFIQSKRQRHSLTPWLPENKHLHLTSLGQQRNDDSKDDEEDIIHGENFSNLDVLESVFNRLNGLVTHMQFSAVCRSWRWVAQHCCPPTQFPCLMLSSDYQSDDRLFFNFSDSLTHTWHLPEAHRSCCCGSYCGWLIMQTFDNGPRQKIFLIDLFSKAKIHLPIMTREYSQDSVDPSLKLMSVIMKVALSSAPKSNDGAINTNCLVAAVDRFGHLFWCRLGDQSWTPQHFHKSTGFEFGEILFHDGLLFGIEFAGTQIMVMKFDDHHLRFRARRHPSLFSKFGDYVRKADEFIVSSYMVEWRGHIYFVLLKNRGTGNIMRCDTEVFHTYKLDSGWNLVKVENLGEGMIFILGNGYSKFISVTDISPALNLKGNRI